MDDWDEVGGQWDIGSGSLGYVQNGSKDLEMEGKHSRIRHQPMGEASASDDNIIHSMSYLIAPSDT